MKKFKDMQKFLRKHETIRESIYIECVIVTLS